jgi:hypothetical protein
MRGVFKPLLLILTILGGYVAAAAGAFWFVVIRPGMIHVDVQTTTHDLRTDLTIPVPAMLINGLVDGVADGLRVRRLTHVAGNHEIEEAEEWAPMIGAIARELETAPDFTMVEVEERGEHVVIERVDGELRVRVDNGHERVQVTLPRDSSRRVLRALSQI